MRLTLWEIDTVPRLAWCARLARGSDSVEVFHGPWVERGDDFFFEGAWAGDFQSRDFDVDQAMGSGGKISGNSLRIVSPSHTLERIYVLRVDQVLWISNSLAFVLASAQDNVNSHALLYSVKLASITDGLQGYAKWLPTRNGRKIRLFYHCNLSIDSQLRIIEEAKRPVEEFKDFGSYKAFLVRQVAAIHANANDPKRRIKYPPIATISSGYDSSSAAVLARSIGCSEALTFSQAREGSEYSSDSGARIAAKLGMQIHAFDRLDYLREEGFPEAEFHGWGAQESVWANLLERRMLFTGFNGDKIWDRNCKEVTSSIKRGDPSGHNLNAFRLRVGWIHLPVPFLGCTSHPSIHRISVSGEMEPWCTNNQYDRPIPRRLLEEAGVERFEFGTKKRAAGLNLITEGLKERMTKASYEDYLRYYRTHWTMWMTLKRRFFVFLRALYFRHVGLNRRISDLLRNRLGVQPNLPILLPRDARIGRYGDLDALSLLVHWSTEKIIPQYKVKTD